MRHFIIPLVVISFCTVAMAQDVERVLVPIYEPLPIPGAFGSLWVSDFRILNASDDLLFIDNFGTGCNFDPCPPSGLAPRATISGAHVRNAHGGDWNPGAVLRADKQTLDRLVFQLRVRDVSRAAEGWGTWTPVIRESRAKPGPVHLLNVPVEDGYRIMLRVYSFRDSGRVTVRIFGTADGTFAYPFSPDPMLGEFQLDLQLTGFLSDPGYGQFTGLTELVQGKGYRLVRLEIIPENGLLVWAMVSVTNNVTQQVTGVYPNE
jgi:hypothetical protein